MGMFEYTRIHSLLVNWCHLSVESHSDVSFQTSNPSVWPEEFMDEEEEEPEMHAVSEKDILSQVGPFQVPQHHEIIPLSILGSDQQNLEIKSFRLEVGWAQVSTRF